MRSSTDQSFALRRGVTSWLRRWARCVREVDYVAARPLFDEEMSGFGTHAAAMRGLDEVEHLQWRAIWPNSRDFDFVYDQAEIVASSDALSALVVTPWTSTGFDVETGEPFPRPGRATIALRRDDPHAPWRGVHTHFSLAPGVPPRTRRGA